MAIKSKIKGQSHRTRHLICQLVCMLQGGFSLNFTLTLINKSHQMCKNKLGYIFLEMMDL